MLALVAVAHIPAVVVGLDRATRAAGPFWEMAGVLDIPARRIGRIPVAVRAMARATRPAAGRKDASC